MTTKIKSSQDFSFWERVKINFQLICIQTLESIILPEYDKWRQTIFETLKSDIHETEIPQSDHPFAGIKELERFLSASVWAHKDAVTEHFLVTQLILANEDNRYIVLVQLQERDSATVVPEPLGLETFLQQFQPITQLQINDFNS